MKTTLDLPDALLRRAKVAAAQTDTTLKDLVTKALERELDERSRTHLSADKPSHVVDSDGLPCLPRRGTQVSDELISRIREEQGI